MKNGEAHKRALAAMERKHLLDPVAEFETALRGVSKNGDFIEDGGGDQQEDTDPELLLNGTDLKLRYRVQGGGAGGKKGKKGKNDNQTARARRASRT